MIAATWPLHDFAGFLQIISWIIFPFLAIAVLITVFIHYRQKKNEKKAAGIDESLVSAHARYKALWKDHEALRQTHLGLQQEFMLMENEMKRQDWVIHQLREDLILKEREIAGMHNILQGATHVPVESSPSLLDPQYQISTGSAPAS